MEPACLQHCLTATERQFFDTQGYLIIRGALSPTEVAAVQAAFDRVHQARAAESDPRTGLFSATDFVKDDPALLALVDHPVVLPKVWGILGWNIYLYHAHLDATPPAAGRILKTEREYRAWHQDSMQANEDLECHPRPRLSLKVSYYIQGATAPGMGNTLVLPGSQLQDEFGEQGDDPPGTIPLVVGPGDAVLLDRRVWHSRSLNQSSVLRKAIFYGYAYRWLQRKDDMQVAHLLAGADPIRRQMLGAQPSGANGTYAPTPADVPLREWLREHGALASARDHHAGRRISRPPR